MGAAFALQGVWQASGWPPLAKNILCPIENASWGFEGNILNDGQCVDFRQFHIENHNLLRYGWAEVGTRRLCPYS
jgi:hypothetical protein